MFDSFSIVVVGYDNEVMMLHVGDWRFGVSCCLSDGSHQQSDESFGCFSSFFVFSFAPCESLTLFDHTFSSP